VFHFGTVRLGCVSQAVASFACFPGIFRAAAQTPQPWLFVETIANGKVTGAVTFLRDDSSGALTRLANSQTTFANPCGPSMIDPKGRFLYGYCANGLSMYSVNASTLALVVNGCGGGGSGSAVQQPPPPPPPVITPSGAYTLTLAPSATPAGSTKSFPLSAISLTLVVK
jgi:hypothetical protein